MLEIQNPVFSGGEKKMMRILVRNLKLFRLLRRRQDIGAI